MTNSILKQALIELTDRLCPKHGTPLTRGEAILACAKLILELEECQNCGACDGAGHRCMDCEKELTEKECQELGGTTCVDCSRLLS